MEKKHDRKEQVERIGNYGGNGEERFTPATGKKVGGRVVHRDFRKDPIVSNLTKEEQIAVVIAGMPTEMVKELAKVKNGEAILKSNSEYRESMSTDPKAKKVLDIYDVEMSKNGDKILYGMDEIGVIYDLYGKDSEIYNAMAEGKVVSVMIEESMNKNKKAGNLETAKREELLLVRCLKREREKGFDEIQHDSY